MKRNLWDVLAGDVPDDVPHWVVEMHAEFDNPDLTPLEAVKKAAEQILLGHCWMAIHIRSGLQYSINLGSGEVVEVKEIRFNVKT